ncbi:ATP-dependent Lon protease pim1 [Mortierella sp. AD094]|nr:ATP-dependent Lon protease pim1 [Mortierella sp. AD094]
MNNIASKSEVMPVMDMMPIQFSHRVIMMCIEEIKLRGLRHPHLFRNAFHGPSVEAALSMLANPRKHHLFSAKMMRIDTVAGLLTTALSRTYPPLIPPHIQEMFQNPNGRFFFELLGMLPELNRYLFVEILDLCCALVDQQSFNQISHSKLAVFPGSCCFGLNEYKPNWDARYLMSADLKKFSSAFYHAIYAYREERDLTEDELQDKLDTRAQILEQERIAALEREHGYRGAQAILRMEARIAQGLPAESPNAMREISLYVDRKEKVVADDAISILDIQLDDDEDGASKVPDLDRVEEEDEEEEVENVQAVIRDLRKSKSVASLGKSLYENQPRTLPPIPISTLTAGKSNSSLHKNYMSPISPSSPRSPMSPDSSIFSGGHMSRSNTIARSVSLKLHPVSPGDIFGISQRAVEKRELEGFLAVARTVKRRKSAFSKRTLQQRQMHKMRVLAVQDSSSARTPSSPLVTISTKSIRAIRRSNRPQLSQMAITPSTGTQTCLPIPTAAALRRERAKMFRKELEVYQAKGHSFEDAIKARESDIKQQRRKEKRAKKAALAKAEAEREAAAAAAAAAVADSIAQHGLTHSEGKELTMEEAEILEAFDYLSDEEFQEFKELAGLTDEDIEAIRAKAVALSLSKVTHDIQNLDVDTVSAPISVVPEAIEKALRRISVVPQSASADSNAPESTGSFDEGDDIATEAHAVHNPVRSSNRPFNIPHMTSMDLMFKHASVVGDANLRLYPTRPSSPTISDYESDSMHGGLLSRAASVMRARSRGDYDDDCEDQEMDDEDYIVEVPTVRHPTVPAIPYSTRPTAASKSISYATTPMQMQYNVRESQEIYIEAPQQQINNHQYHQTKNEFAFETIVVDYEDEEDEEMQETEEEAELRELLESMSEEERHEFLRLSNQESMGISIASDVLVVLSRTTVNPTLTHHATAKTPKTWSAFDGHLRPFSTITSTSSTSAHLNELRPRSLHSLVQATRPAAIAHGYGHNNYLISGSTLTLSRRSFSSTARVLKDKSDSGKGDDGKSGSDGKDSGSGSSSSSGSEGGSSGSGSGSGSGSSGSGSGRGGKISKFTFDVGSGGPSTNILENGLSKPAIPEVYPQVLTLPIGRRPLFPGFYKAVVIKNPAVANAIKELMKRGQPYVGAFLLKDEELDIDTVTSIDQIHPVGVFAQITTVFPASAGSDEGSITAVLYPHRRIKIKELLPPLTLPDGSEAPREGLLVKEAAEGVERQQPITIKVGEESSVVSSGSSSSTTTIEKVAGTESAAVEGSTVDGASSTSDSASKDHHHLPTDFLAKEYAVTLSNVENMTDEPYNRKNQVIRAITSEIVAVFKDIASLNPLFRDQIANFSMSQSAGNVFEEPAKLADFATAVSQGDPEELQSVLESLSIEDRMQKALLVLKKELMNAQLQSKISKDVENKIAKRQREYYLMEQLKGIKKELGIESDGKDKLIEKFKEKSIKLAMPEQVKKVFDEEITKLEHLEPAASEFNVTRNYLDWLTNVPWGVRSPENYDIRHATRVLDEDHYGLKDVKDRILEFIAVGRLRGTVEGKIICLAGPPGVGKTSIGKSIARALDREFYRFSVGGLTDVAEIKGHRRTYVGAMPGKVVQALKRVQTENPLILIDEVDKVGRGHQGDPASALLELLDPEQNGSFLDHYMDVPIDLSKVLFVCTANVLETIPGPLLDRMEVIQLSGYISDEKVAIASRYLAPSAKEAAGLQNANVTLHDGAIEALIKNYCRESGVRNLKKQIDKVFRKAALKIVQDLPDVERVIPKKEEIEDKEADKEEKVNDDPLSDFIKKTVPDETLLDDEGATKQSEKDNKDKKSKGKDDEKDKKPKLQIPSSVSVDITAENLKDYVGPAVFQADRLYDATPPGVVMGLAWTSMGGSALYIESCLDGGLTEKSRPNFLKTGQMGDVMKESTSIAYTFAKNLIGRRFPENRFFNKAAIHLHVPEGATPKDGPSAGITMTTSLLSLALNKPLDPTIAMTGELTLTGKVLKIGGLKEKTIAAKRSGVKTLIFPQANLPDWEELPENVKEGVTGVPAAWYEDVYKVVFGDSVSEEEGNSVWVKELPGDNEVSDEADNREPRRDETHIKKSKKSDVVSSSIGWREMLKW